MSKIIVNPKDESLKFEKVIFKITSSKIIFQYSKVGFYFEKHCLLKSFYSGA